MAEHDQTQKRKTLSLKIKKPAIAEAPKAQVKKKSKLNPFYPLKYGEFRLKKKTFTVEPRIITCLNRFIYRYRLAKIFKEITVIDEKYMDKTIHGYSTANKLFLTYTAYEAVKEAAIALGISSKRYESLEINSPLAARIRKNVKLKVLLETESESTDVRKGVERFYHSALPSNNALQVAYMIRNCFGHGSFTTLGSGLNDKTYMDDIDALSEQLLEHCDMLFDDSIAQCIILSS